MEEDYYSNSYTEADFEEVAILTTSEINSLIEIIGASYRETPDGVFMLINEYKPALLPPPEFSIKYCSAVYRAYFTEGLDEVVAKSTSSVLRLSKNVFSTAKHTRIKNMSRECIMNNYEHNTFPSKRNREYFNNSPWVNLINIPLSSKTSCWLQDPVDPERKVSTGGDIVFLKKQFHERNDSGETIIPIVIPRAALPTVGEYCFLVGYPAKKNEKKMRKWIDNMYSGSRVNPILKGLKDKLETLADEDSQIIDEIKKQLPELIDDFFPQSTRVTTVGKIIAYSKGIIGVDASSFPGMSGGACFDVSGKLLGSIIGSVSGANYNLVLGVHHPSFKWGYLEHVNKTLSKEELELAREYLDVITIDVNM